MAQWQVVFIALRYKNLQFLLSQPDLDIDISLLEIILPRYFREYYSDSISDFKIILLLANHPRITISLLNLTVVNNWLTNTTKLLDVEKQWYYLTQPDQHGKTCLDYACELKLIQMIKLLLLNGVVISNQYVYYGNVVKLINQMSDKPEETKIR